MTPVDWLFDGLLGVTLLWLAGRAIFAHEIFSSVVTFIAFGLLTARAWLRLGAPDEALAAAVQGGAVTGALLLAALTRLERYTRDAGGSSDSH